MRKGTKLLSWRNAVIVAFVSFALFSASLLPGGEVGIENPSGYRVIKVEELKSMLPSKKFLLINVSFKCTGYIPGTDREIPFNLIDRYVDTLPEPEKVEIILYCNRGYMSRVAAKKLISLGYRDVYIVDGGLEKWEMAGYRVEERK